MFPLFPAFFATANAIVDTRIRGTYTKRKFDAGGYQKFYVSTAMDINQHFTDNPQCGQEFHAFANKELRELVSESLCHACTLTFYLGGLETGHDSVLVGPIVNFVK